MMNLNLDKPIRYLCISDVHLGHQRNPTINIVNNLKHYFYNYKSNTLFSNLDIIFIVGDLFDQLIDCGQESLFEALTFIVDIIGFCERENIKLRILEGTPSHDRKQSRLIETISNIKKSKADVKWINDLLIEYIPDLNLNILYIPDEYTSSADITLSMVKDLLKHHQLEQVDIAMMHGMFKYQMKNIPGRHDTHDENEYLKIVKHFINIGHIHTFSNYERILAQGSFDRLAHGEEEAKGGILCTIRDGDTDYYQFIENTRAKQFKTFDVSCYDLDNSIDYLHKNIQKLQNESYVRIKAYKLHPIFSIITDLKKHYPFIHFSKLTIEDEQEQNVNYETSSSVSYNVIEIREENVVPLIIDEVKIQYSISDKDERYLERLLSNLQDI